MNEIKQLKFFLQMVINNENEVKAYLIEKWTDCPQCQNPLKSRWLAQEEQEKLIFDISDPEFRNGSELSQVEVYFCPKCGWEKPSLLVKTEYENIPANEEKQKYQKERELVEKIAAFLLPQQDIKIRFVRSIIFEGEKKLGKTILSKIPELNKEFSGVCLYIEEIVKRDKVQPGLFCEVVAHEFAHADPEVFKNPQHNPKKHHRDCSCRKPDIFFNPHAGDGHDKIWHEKYDEFRERIKNESLAAGSDYVALGKEFTHGKPTSSEEKSDQPETTKQNQENKTNQSFSNILIIALIIGALAIFGGLVYWAAKKTKKVRSL